MENQLLAKKILYSISRQLIKSNAEEATSRLSHENHCIALEAGTYLEVISVSGVENGLQNMST